MGFQLLYFFKLLVKDAMGTIKWNISSGLVNFIILREVKYRTHHPPLTFSLLRAHLWVHLRPIGSKIVCLSSRNYMLALVSLSSRSYRLALSYLPYLSATHPVGLRPWCYHLMSVCLSSMSCRKGLASQRSKSCKKALSSFQFSKSRTMELFCQFSKSYTMEPFSLLFSKSCKMEHVCTTQGISAVKMEHVCLFSMNYMKELVCLSSMNCTMVPV